jgi:hypothetical protein
MMLQLTELVKPYKTTDLSWLHGKTEDKIVLGNAVAEVD